MKNIAALLFIILLVACSEKKQNIYNEHNIETRLTTLILPDITIDIDAGKKNECPAGMALVDHDYCTNMVFTCLKYADEETAKKQHKHPRICSEFKDPGICRGKIKHMKFCMDKCETPGCLQKPKLMVSFNDLVALAKEKEKRICTDQEFETACSGPSWRPYPYGFIRNKECNIDKKPIQFNQNKLNKMDQNEINRLDQSVVSGSITSCISEEGIFDLTGNADENYLNTLRHFKPYKNVLKGGHWTNAINVCYNWTYVHNENFKFYVTGGRLCKDI